MIRPCETHEYRVITVSKMEQKDWIELIGGGFAFQTAPFAMHANDKARAHEYLEEAIGAGLHVSDAVGHARSYLAIAPSFPTNESEQLERVRMFFSGKLPG